jgi:hypothetical protein
MNFTLDLCKRNDGYMVSTRDGAVIELVDQGLVTMRDVGGGYSIARVVQDKVRPIYLHRCGRGRWTARRAEIAANAALTVRGKFLKEPSAKERIVS